MQSEPTTCQCGSGLFADWLYDGHGIPLVKACERCADEKLKGFRPDLWNSMFRMNSLRRAEL